MTNPQITKYKEGDWTVEYFLNNQRHREDGPAYIYYHNNGVVGAVGKSTSAAYVFFKLKEAGKNSELIREYVKEWCWEERSIKLYDQMYFLGKQVKRESDLFNKVDYAVSDSPVYLNAFYSNKNCPAHLNRGIQEAVLAFYEQAAADGIKHVNVVLKRTKPYNKKGRYQTEEEAISFDSEIKLILNKLNVSYLECNSDKESLDELLKQLNVL